MTTILRINGSARNEGSITRQLTDQLVERLLSANPGANLVTRDLGGTPLYDDIVASALGTEEADRTPAQLKAFAVSDELVREFIAADFVVLASPIYNFSVPAAVKAYIDQIVRAGLTFQYTDEGLVGLVPDRPTYLVMASGGTAVGSEGDFASGYLRYLLGFLGVTNVHVIGADMLTIDPDAAMARAGKQLDAAVPVRSAA